MKYFIYFYIITFIFTAGYLGADNILRVQELGPEIFEKLAEKIVESLDIYISSKKESVFIKVDYIRNRTTQHIEVYVLLDYIILLLVKKDYKVLKEDHDTRQLDGPIFLLTGSISEDQRKIISEDEDFTENEKLFILSLELTSSVEAHYLWMKQEKFILEQKVPKNVW